MLKIKLVSLINVAIFLVAIFVQISTSQIESDSFISKVKYIVCLFGIVVGALTISTNHKQAVMVYELKEVLGIAATFLLITLFFIAITRESNDRTITEILLLTLPILYAFVIINTLTFKTLNVCMPIILVASMLAYFLNLHMGLNQFLSSLMTINFAESYSLLESSAFAGTSIALALYFLFFRKNKVWTILSILFVFLTFKRLAMLTALLLIFLPKIVNCNKPVNKTILRITKILIFVISIGYFYLLIPSTQYFIHNNWHFDIDKFTMGRSWRFRLLYDNPHFINTGLGSTWSFLTDTYGFALEMDIIRLLIEVTPIGVIIFINNMFNIAKKNTYCYIVMLYLFGNLITSHSLANMFSWLLYYIIFGMIIYHGAEYIPPKQFFKMTLKHEKEQ